MPQVMCLTTVNAKLKFLLITMPKNVSFIKEIWPPDFEILSIEEVS